MTFLLHLIANLIAPSMPDPSPDCIDWANPLTMRIMPSSSKDEVA